MTEYDVRLTDREYAGLVRFLEAYEAEIVAGRDKFFFLRPLLKAFKTRLLWRGVKPS